MRLLAVLFLGLLVAPSSAEISKAVEHAIRQRAARPCPLDRLPNNWRREVNANLRLNDDDCQSLLLISSKKELEGALLYLLSLQPQAEAFVLAHLSESLPLRNRLMVVRNIPTQSHWLRSARVDSLLQTIVVSEPDQELAMAALNSLRSLAMRRLRQALGKRLAAAKVGQHVENLAGFEEEDERLLLFQKGAMLPGFLRRVPPVFTVETIRPLIRVLAFGDFGSGDDNQKANAAAMAAYARNYPFDFGLTLGDNFYDEGMTGTDDSRWRTGWEDLYGPLGITFYPSFGNHDWYGPDSASAEILYSQQSSSWHMPSPYYSFKAGPAQFFAIDSDDFSAAQLRWLSGELDRSKARWKIVYGHHPPYIAADSPQWDHDQRILSTLMPILGGRADVYIAGHVHDLEHLRPVGGVNLFIAGGGGAQTYPIHQENRHSLFAKQAYGFAVLEIEQISLMVRFVDKNGTELYHARITKN